MRKKTYVIVEHHYATKPSIFIKNRARTSHYINIYKYQTHIGYQMNCVPYYFILFSCYKNISLVLEGWWRLYLCPHIQAGGLVRLNKSYCYSPVTIPMEMILSHNILYYLSSVKYFAQS